MADFVHCNACYRLPSKSTEGLKFYLTSCYHILCHECSAGPGFPCKVCKQNAKIVEINRNMDKELQALFKPLKQTIEERLNQMKKKHAFQKMMYDNYIGFFMKQRSKMTEMMKHINKQAEVSKEKEKELALLKEWVADGEKKIEDMKAENAQLQQAMAIFTNTQFDRQGGFMLQNMSKLFTENKLGSSNNGTSNVESFQLSQQFEEQRVREFHGHIDSQNEVGVIPDNFLMTSVSDVDMNSSITMTGGLVSPAPSTNCSVVSEMTTPKMLGINKRGISPGSGLFGGRRTPSGVMDNPYMNMLLTSGQRIPSGGRYTGMAGQSQRAPQSSARLRSPANGMNLAANSAGCTGTNSVTRGNVIPRANL